MMVAAVLVLYVLVSAAVIFGVFLFTAWMRQRRLQGPSKVPPGFKRTEEIYYDPTTGVRQRVWYNEATGERFYQREEK
ncbi:hypothetical protein [Alicyclobacillus sp. SO9]|uniref:hypothetical protein n=1 Tax=Alicyclobacillus sp. SO9 TaxID=2665646 RepID=UPI0018E7F99B|nr:hypothetical protein [Alicyclobacillus sp. SO9]QQE79949.1 hypothetical protein GI364_05570 [Alicyclobacillus sp. SO9]